MNRTTTVIVALIVAAGLSTMIYSVPAQRALAWGDGPSFGGCGFGWDGCGGGFFVHKTIIQTIHQVNGCTNKETHVTPPPPCQKSCAGNDQSPTHNEDNWRNSGAVTVTLSNQAFADQNQKVCLNTAVNNAGHGFRANNVPSQGLGTDNAINARPDGTLGPS
jgi:hypothetical protein